jgi:predicted Fe-Mo cluster-binding NifX family protein
LELGTLIALNNSMMRIAISIWEKRVAPVFDVSKRLLIVLVESKQEIRRYEKTIAEVDSINKSRYLAELKVEVLICGAISQFYEEVLLASGIQVIPEICGQVEEVIQVFIAGKLDAKRFLMPGCCERRKRLQRRHGRNWV